MNSDNEIVLKEILEQSLAGYWDWDIPTGNEYLSPSFKRMFGYEDHEIEDRADSWKKLIFQEDLPGVYENFNKHEESKGKIPYYNEVRFHHRNGSTVWVICTGKVIEWDENGKAKRMVGCHIDISERKRTETDLLKTSTMLETLLNAIPDVIGVQDLDHGIIRYNAAGYSLVGQTPEGISGKKCFEVIGHKIPCDICATVETYRTKRPARVEKFVPELGIWLEARAYPVLDANGEMRFVIEHLRDITKSKHAEEALRKNNLFISSLLKAIPVAVFFKDNQGKYLGCNSIFSDVMGVTEDQIRGKTVHELWPSELAEKYHVKDLELMQTRKHQVYEFNVKAKDGRILPVIYAKDVFLDGAGEVAGLVGAFLDISDLKMAEAALRKSEEKFRTLIETTNTGYVFIDENGLVSDANDEYVRLSGHSKLEELRGRSVIEWTAEADKERNAMAVKTCFQKGFIRNFETMYVDKKGKTTPIEINATCLPVAGKVQIITLCRDISERRRTEELLANAQKLESLGVLAGGIAHDFNNLMGGIFGYIEVASVTSTEENVKQDLAKVMQTIDRARDLTRQLLTFAKGGSPIQEVSPLFPFIEQTAQFALSGSNALCRFDIPEGLWSVNFDKNQIGQVIDNLVINAQQAMPLGGTIVLAARNVALSESEHPLLKKGDYVRLSVIDTGIGIPNELQKRIFDPFFTTKAKGHGLGLATSYSIINRHGGCIDVFSEQGKGTTFNVYLPAAREQANRSNDVQIKEHRGSGTFLLMDDEEVVRKAVSLMLKTFGYNVVCKVNGQEAIDYVASAMRDNQALAGMLFDLTVPGAMGGKEAIRQIRKMGVHIPAFVSSGYADDPVMRNPAEYGFTASISKPYRGSELMEILEKHMKRMG